VASTAGTRAQERVVQPPALFGQQRESYRWVNREGTGARNIFETGGEIAVDLEQNIT
jgi:hypothetical protein